MNTCMGLCTHQKSYKLNKGIMLIFVAEKNRPLLLAKGVDKWAEIPKKLPQSLLTSMRRESSCHYPNRHVSQMRVLLVACRELAVDYNTLP